MMKIKELFTKALTWLKSLSVVQAVLLGVVSILVIGLCVAGVVLLVGKNDAPAESTEISESTETQTQTETESETETEIETETEEIIVINVTLTASSVAEDLKIKIVDENGALIPNQSFVILVTPEGAESGTEYNDHDTDGIIYISSIKSGKYTVTLQPIEGFEAVENPIAVTVKKVVYQKVEVEDEIKDEGDIDVGEEDTADNGLNDENTNKDTLPLLDSTVTTTPVSKDQVDFSNFPVASVGSEFSTITVNKTDTTTTEVLGTLSATLPSAVKMYTYGLETSTSASITFSLTDEMAILSQIDWSVSDESVVTMTLDESGYVASLVANAEGTATVSVTITYFSDELDTPLTETISCEVTVGDYSDASTQLKDVNSTLLYLDNEAKTIATTADYTSATEFYCNPVYTGWQTLNGVNYYFKEDHTVATGVQIIGGVRYMFNEDGSLTTQITGIDVSKWQGSIDWAAVADSGVDFVIIRCGYRAAKNGAIIEDPYFKQNIAGAKANGLKVGVYFFTQAINEAEAIEEASAAMALVSGYSLDFPIFIDTEAATGGRANSLGVAERTAIVKAFCETVKNGGYKPGVYASTSWYNKRLNASELQSYFIWVAQYADECTYTGKYDMWQYTSKGSIAGIKGNVDMNIYYK